MRTVDFATLYRPYLKELTSSFERFIQDGYYVGGDYIQEFEGKMEKYLGVSNVIGCKSGTHALILALIAAGVTKGDEVIVPANTYYATAYSIYALGATPIFCDCRIDDGLIDCTKIEELINSKTKAIMVVHLYGIILDLNPVKRISSKYGLKIIEDCAHAFGSKKNGLSVGYDSEFACFSFYPTKNMGAFGDGGMVVTNSQEISQVIKQNRYLAYDQDHTLFEPTAIHARLDTLQAYLLTCMIEHVDKLMLRRREIGTRYIKNLKGRVKYIDSFDNENFIPYVFPIFISNRDKYISFMENNGIKLQINYKVNLANIPHFNKKNKSEMPMTELFMRRVVTLPTFPTISNEDVDYICDKTIEFVSRRI